MIAAIAGQLAYADPVNTVGITAFVLVAPMPENWIPGLQSPKPSSADLKKVPTVEGVSEEGKNEKVISLEELEQAKESGFDVPNDGRAPGF